MRSLRSTRQGRRALCMLSLVLAVVASACKDDGVDRVEYSGKTGPATVDAENAPEIFAALFEWPRIPPLGSEGDGRPPSGAASFIRVEGLRAAVEAATAARASAVAKPAARAASASPAALLKVTIEETIHGRVGGRIVVDGAVDILGRGTLELEWKRFDDGFGHRVDGRGRFVIEQGHPHINGDLDRRLEIDRVDYSGAGLARAVSGTVRIDGIGGAQVLHLDLDVHDRIAGRSHRLERFEITNELAPGHLTYLESYEGRLYMERHGWVDVSSDAPLEYEPDAPGFLGFGGPIVVAGGRGGRARIIPGLDNRARIEADEEDLDAWEKVAVFDWAGIGATPLSNTAPTLELLGFDPDPAVKASNLRMGFLFDDAERDPVTVDFAWMVEGEPVSGERGPELSSDYFAKGDWIDVTVTASDGELESIADDRIKVLNSRPVADAGPDVVVTFDTRVELDGRASTDADGEALMHAWRIAEGPVTPPTAEIESADQSLAYLRPDVQGTWTVELTARDGYQSGVDQKQIDVVPAPLFEQAIEIDVFEVFGEYVESLAVGDVTGDGRPDVVAGTRGDQTGAVVLAQQPDGTLASPVRYAVDTSAWQNAPATIVVADVDGDDRPDVVVALPSGLWILRQQPGGALADAELLAYEGSEPPASVVGGVGDLDGDGLNDVVVLRAWNDGTEDVLVRHQQVDGTLGAGIEQALSTRPYGLAVGDIDADDRDEVVVLRSREVDLLDELEDGSLALTLFSRRSRRAAEIGDIDGDGSGDLVLMTNDDVSVLLQSESGELDPEQILPRMSRFGGGRRGLTLGDVDGSGRRDIVFGMDGYDMGVHLQRDDGTFMPDQRTGEFDQPRSPDGIAAADVTGDGREDVIATNGRTISILPARPPSP